MKLLQQAKLRQRAFASAPCAVRLPKASRRLQPRVRCSSYDARWPDPQFIEETKQQYVGLGMYAKPVANAEEARVLLSLGYVFLDVRPTAEVERVGKVRNSVNIPYLNATRKYDPEQNKTTVETSPNPKFLETVSKQFPKKEDVLLLVADANGKSGGQEALQVLEDAGYENLVGVVGGFSSFWRTFDAKLARRPSRGAFVEDPWSSGSSQGMFAGES